MFTTLTRMFRIGLLAIGWLSLTGPLAQAQRRMPGMAMNFPNQPLLMSGTSFPNTLSTPSRTLS